jgi:thioredoxin-like negative regulator of GroEL
MTNEHENNTPANHVTAQVKPEAAAQFSAKGIAPDVLMLMGAECAFCGPMMQMLTELMKAGRISELKIVNIEKNSVLAQEIGVRSVPWLQIGPFELQGSRTKQELLEWLQRASSLSGVTEYLEEMLIEGKINYASKLLQRYPPALKNIIGFIADPEAKMNVRLGVGAIIEDIAETDVFKEAIPRLKKYLSHADARVRGDACHYLSLTKDVSCIPAIEALLNDESEEVREIAQDSLEDFRSIA